MAGLSSSDFGGAVQSAAEEPATPVGDFEEGGGGGGEYSPVQREPDSPSSLGSLVLSWAPRVLRPGEYVVLVLLVRGVRHLRTTELGREAGGSSLMRARSAEMEAAAAASSSSGQLAALEDCRGQRQPSVAGGVRSRGEAAKPSPGGESKGSQAAGGDIERAGGFLPNAIFPQKCFMMSCGDLKQPTVNSSSEDVSAELLPECVRNFGRAVRPLLAETCLDAEEQRWTADVRVLPTEIANYLKTKIMAVPGDNGEAAALPPRSEGTLKLRFDSAVVPLISIETYLKRLELFSCSKECFVLAVIYLDRLNHLQTANNSKFCISRINIHRFLLLSLLIATKYFDDIYYTNEYYAKIGGIPTKELSYLEVHFLNLVKYDLYVSEREYVQYLYTLKENKRVYHLVECEDGAEEQLSPRMCLGWAKQVIDQEDCSTEDDEDDRRAPVERNKVAAA